MRVIIVPQECPKCGMQMTFMFTKTEWWYCCGHPCLYEGKHEPITDDLYVQIEYGRCIWRGSLKRLINLPDGKLPPCKVAGTAEEHAMRQWQIRDPEGYDLYMEERKKQ